MLGGAFIAVAVGLAVAQAFDFYDQEFFTTNSKWLVLRYEPWGFQSFFALILQLGLLLAAALITLRRRTITPWALVAVPIALASLSDFIPALPLLSELSEYALGFWGILLAGFGALMVLLGLVIVRDRLWLRSSGTPAIYTLGAIAATTAGVGYFISPWTSRGGGLSFGARWYSFDSWWITASMVVLLFTLAYPIVASLLAQRAIGAPLAFGAALALLVYYGSVFHFIVIDYGGRTSISVVIPLVAILTSGALAAAIWWKPRAEEING